MVHVAVPVLRRTVKALVDYYDFTYFVVEQRIYGRQIRCTKWPQLLIVIRSYVRI